MRAGELRHRIIIQQTTQTIDAESGIVDSWATYLSAWASVTPNLQIGNREWFDAQKFNAEVSHLIKLRNRSGITPKMRVSWDSRIFNILAVIDVEERGRWTYLHVKEAI